MATDYRIGIRCWQDQAGDEDTKINVYFNDTKVVSDATIPRLGIGEISKQLKSKLKQTEFIFNAEVKEVTNDRVLMQSGDEKAHSGLIIAGAASSLIGNLQD